MTPESVQAAASKREHKAQLDALQPGRYCVHRGWGFGLIQAIDPTDGKVVIDFEGKPGHRMDPLFCAQTLDILPDNHVLVLRQKEPERIQKLIEDDPVQLLLLTLATFPNRAATAIELEGILARLMGPEKFKRWWSGARKAVARDPRVGVPLRKHEVYFVREETVSKDIDLVEQFKTVKSAKRRITLAEEILKAARQNEDLRQHLAPVLEAIATIVRESRLTEVDKLHGAWVRDDLALLLGEDTSAYEPSLSSLVEDTRQHIEIAEKLPVHLQDRLLDLLKTTHPDQWRDIVQNLLKNSKGKFTAECINFLIANECEDELTQTLLRWQAEQNLRAPVLLWILKNRNTRRYEKLLKDLISPRLLNSIFYAIDYEALQSAGTRRVALAEHLGNDATLIADLLAEANHEEARDLANQLMMNQGFEELDKKSLMARFIRMFPGVQSLVASDRTEREGSLVVSRDSHRRRQEELQDIISKRIPDNSKAIAAAREHGDLRENSEYKMAKQEQAVLLARRAQLEAELGRAQITDFTEASPEQVSVGSVVTLAHDGTTVTYTILGAWDSDPANHVISYKTQVGTALLGRKPGETVTLREEGRDITWTIQAIGRYVDAVRA